jgi:beta-1,4-mannosyl-glycoprotein beta-1,4-N-acetylglucosaminyltransferase
MKVYKVSTYTDEWELTEVILNELDSVVDGFIFLEASHTYQMNPRPNFPAFPFKGPKIHHYTFDEYPEGAENWPADKIEELVTGKFIEILKDVGVRPEDVLLYGDADELPFADVIPLLTPQVQPGQIYALEMIFCNYWLNCISHEHPWTQFKVFNFQTLLDIGGSPQENIRKKVVGHMIPQAGWHFSWFGGKERIVQKLESYSHSEFNLPQFKTDEHVENCMMTGRDLFNRGAGHILSPNELPLPAYIENNIVKYKHWIHPNYRDSI